MIGESFRDRHRRSTVEVAHALARAIEEWTWNEPPRATARRLYAAQCGGAAAFVGSVGRSLPSWAALDRTQREAWIALALELPEIACCSVQPS